MPDQKISQLTAIVTVDNSTDVLPIVDTSANTTKKVTPTQLKTSLALDNVDNTSDADKPVSIAQQDALNAKVSSNAAITAGTAPKITFDAKGLVTSGDSLDETDLPTGINANKIGTGVVSTTEFEYLNGVTSAIQTQIDSKQATLVSGTNIKTLNSTSLLGSGNIVLTANPSGVAGAIQFSDGSAFSSDATKFFWDNTNKRLGIGTNAPTTSLQIDYSSSSLNGILINQTGGTSNFSSIGFANNGTIRSTFGMNLNSGEVRWFNGSGGYFATIYSNGVEAMRIDGSQNVNIGATALGARVGIKGSGSTSATTSLLVQNSAGTAILTVRDGGADKQVLMNSALIGSLDMSGSIVQVGSGVNLIFRSANGVAFNSDYSSANASAQLDVSSTTKGFLPPRMTTTQKNAIATPASGLVVYDSTTNKLCCYNGSTWNDLF